MVTDAPNADRRFLVQSGSGLVFRKSHRTSQWASAAGDVFDTWSPATWLPLPAHPDPSPNSPIRTNSHSSVICAFAPPFANPIFASLPSQL